MHRCLPGRRRCSFRFKHVLSLPAKIHYALHRVARNPGRERHIERMFVVGNGVTESHTVAFYLAHNCQVARFTLGATAEFRAVYLENQIERSRPTMM